MGRPEFETVVAMAPKKRIKTLYISRTSTGARNLDNYTLLSSPNTVSRVLGLRIIFAGTSQALATQYHQVEVGYKSNNTVNGNFIDISLIRARSTFSGSNIPDMSIDQNFVDTSVAGITAYPSDLKVFADNVKAIIFDDKNGLRFSFTNNDTGTGLTLTRDIYISVLEEDIR